LVYQAVTEFCESPHATNIDLVPFKEKIEVMNEKDESMWNLWKKENFDNKYRDRSSCADFNPAPNPKRAEKERICDGKRKFRHYKSFDKLSWATLGYQYDWTARAYRENNKSNMPRVLDQLGKIFARIDVFHNKRSNNSDSTHDNQSFTSSAAIVNYYSPKSTMGGHRDDLELDFTKPVVSINLGLSAVFLLGGKTKEEGPVLPILVRSGDVMLLGGESRLNFHGMARVIPSNVPLPSVGNDLSGLCITNFQINSWSSVLGGDSDNDYELPKFDREAIVDFMSKHRININLRQVLPPSMDCIP